MPIKFINLCPHPVHLVGDNGAVVTFAESGNIARVDVRREKRKVTLDIAEGIQLSMEVCEIEHASVINLPEPTEGVLYITSSYVSQFAKRPDVICPNTDSTALKDADNRVIGVKGFSTYI